jgi:hypothetical protein
MEPGSLQLPGMRDDALANQRGRSKAGLSFTRQYWHRSATSTSVVFLY